MTNYYKQCGCGRHADVVPCYDCLWEENIQLRDTLKRIKYTLLDALQKKGGDERHVDEGGGE